MGAFLPITYPERVRDPDRIAAMYRALGCTRVTIGATVRAGDIDTAIAAIDPDRVAQLTFTDGELSADALDALDALIDTGAGYLHVTTSTAALAVWPTPGARAAFDAFRAAADARAQRGGITRPTRATIDRLPRFLHALGCEVAISLETSPQRAAALARVAADDLCWDADNIRVDLPAGKIETDWLYTAYTPTPRPGEIEAFVARIAAALAAP